MTSLSKALENLKYDKRMVNWNQTQGLLTQAEYETYIQKLEDLSHKAQNITLDDDDDDGEDFGTLNGQDSH